MSYVKILRISPILTIIVLLIMWTSCYLISLLYSYQNNGTHYFYHVWQFKYAFNFSSAVFSNGQELELPGSHHSGTFCLQWGKARRGKIYEGTERIVRFHNHPSVFKSTFLSLGPKRLVAQKFWVSTKGGVLPLLPSRGNLPFWQRESGLQEGQMACYTFE